MEGIALMTLMLLLCGLAAMILLFRGKRFLWRFLGGLVSFLALLWWFGTGWMSPVDFLLPRKEARYTEVLGDYQITFVQKPGMDFYDSWLEIKRPDGRVAKLPLDGDDGKWWFLRLHKSERRLTATALFAPLSIRESYVDTAVQEVYSGFYNEKHHLAKLDYR